MSDQVDAKLRELIDKDEIRDVLYRYARGVDRRVRELIEGAFHPDGFTDSGRAEHGSDLADTMLAIGPEETCFTHFIGNQLIEVDGDVAYAESYFMSIREVESDGRAFTRMRGGRYLSRLERRGGVWKIQYRRTVDDWNRLDEVTEHIPGIGHHPGFAAPRDPVFEMRDASFGPLAQQDSQ